MVSNIDGPLVFCLNKDKGMTSFDVVRDFKRKIPKKFKQKVGHFGTLDPFADGLLIIGIQGAARLNDYVHKYSPKSYRATGLIGIKTDSGDLEGEVLETRDSSSLKIEDLKKIASSFIGKYQQRPPYFSAVKHEGRPLYEWAREGVFIDKPNVEREIYDFEILSYKHPKVVFEVRVSTGTYIRSLFEDMLTKLGEIGHLVELSRSRIGLVGIENSFELSKLEKINEDEIMPLSCPLDKLLDFPKLRLNEIDEKLYKNGMPVSLELETSPQAGESWVLNKEDCLIGLGIVRGNTLKPKINFAKS